VSPAVPARSPRRYRTHWFCPAAQPPRGPQAAGGTDDYRHADDGWRIHTADGSRAAHVEHTVAITEDGPRVLAVR